MISVTMLYIVKFFILHEAQLHTEITDPFEGSIGLHTQNLSTQALRLCGTYVSVHLLVMVAIKTQSSNANGPHRGS